MIMDIKSKIIGKTFLLFVSIFLCSCSPEMSTSYKIKNNTTQDFTIYLYELFDTIPKVLVNGYGTKTEIFGYIDYPSSPGFFGKIHGIDSVIITIDDDDRTIRWERPEGRGFIIPDDGIGEPRDDVPKDLYNRDNWELTINGDDERWIFTINEEDLELFE